MAKFSKVPVIIDAIRLTRDMTVHTLEGDMRASAGDWLITGVANEQYFCRDDIFRKTYAPHDEEAKKLLEDKSE